MLRQNLILTSLMFVGMKIM